MEIGAGEFTQESSQLQERCHKWTVDDPLANQLKGLPLVGLRVGAFLNRRTTNLFDELRQSPDKERLYSFFRKDSGILPEIWKDLMPTEGKRWWKTEQYNMELNDILDFL